MNQFRSQVHGVVRWKRPVLAIVVVVLVWWGHIHFGTAKFWSQNAVEQRHLDTTAQFARGWIADHPGRCPSLRDLSLDEYDTADVFGHDLDISCDRFGWPLIRSGGEDGKIGTHDDVLGVPHIEPIER